MGHEPVEARDAIARLVYGYADAVDGGDLEAAARLFGLATYRAVVGGDTTSVRGTDAVLGLLRSMVIIHDDGTPSTKHVTTNLVIDLGADGRTATSRSYFTVLQARPDLPLQVIIAGRYHDAFRLEGGTWRFEDRLIHSDLIGDLSRHLRRSPYEQPRAE